jgi:DNA modification methylase
MLLEQAKLNVNNKTRSNIFNWRGQFTPEFAEYILNSFATERDFILDPFVGSGTVLLESSRLNLRSAGIEVNPAAYFMASFFKFCNFSYECRVEFCSQFELKLNNHTVGLEKVPVFLGNTESYRESYVNLLTFSNAVSPAFTNETERILFSNLLFQSEKDKKLNLKDSIIKSYQYLKNCLMALPFTENRVETFLKDARCVGELFNNQVDIVLTSPPYINVFNYHQNYRGIIESFNYDMLKVAQSEFGSNRKNRGNRFKTVIQYAIDMAETIRSIWNCLKADGKVILVLGRESNVRNIPFYNGKLVTELLKSCGGFSNIRNLERQFMNKFGDNIKEDIIVGTKSLNSLNYGDFGREIALAHLKENLVEASGEVYRDICNAIAELMEVQSSPLFNCNNIKI